MANHKAQHKHHTNPGASTSNKAMGPVCGMSVDPHTAAGSAVHGGKAYYFCRSSAFLLPWVAFFLTVPEHRGVMWRTSWATSLFGATEPIFVPEYWSPPSLFDLAQRTGLDISRASSSVLPSVR